MIPDKIYIGHSWWPNTLDEYWYSEPPKSLTTEEYIRKDALLEWAKDYIERLGDSGVGQRIALRFLIDKLNSM